ncbi:MAG: hypothetical protein K2N18_01470 [Clostridia bacterium]|nr:hypothetical protein [Clostridia bacterium]
MFNWLKRLFCRPRLIARYEDLEAIIDAHNALIKKTLEIMSSNSSVPPKYVLSRFKAIQDAEEKAIAAYWRNKDRKQDKWYRRLKATDSNTMTDIVQDTVQEKEPQRPPEELAATQSIEAEALEAAQQDTQSLEALPSKDNVIEIHINNK